MTPKVPEIETKRPITADDVISKAVAEGSTHVRPSSEELKMSQTVKNHMNDIIKKGKMQGNYQGHILIQKVQRFY